jgi:MFS family permease
MTNWRQWFALWKFRLDNAVSFLVFANFILLSITASAPIQGFLLERLGWQFEMYSVVGVLVITIIICAFLFGFILDKFLHYTQNTMTIQNQRNPELTEILENTRMILGSAKGGETSVSKASFSFFPNKPPRQRPQKPVKCRMTDCQHNTLGLCCQDGIVIGKFRSCVSYLPQRRVFEEKR